MESPSHDALNEQAPLPHKLAAILYADVEGYSRLTGADEAGTHRTLSTYLDLFTETIKVHRGEVKHYAGDAVLADFSTVSDALNCAVAVQQAIQAKNETVAQDKRVQFRIGLNLGEVIVDRGEVYGNGVNVAARLETLAEPGGICASGTVVDAIGTKLPFVYEFLGEQRVKNIDKPVNTYRVNFIGQPSIVSNAVAVPSMTQRAKILTFTIAAVIALVGLGGWFALSRPSATPPSSTIARAIAKANRIAVLPFANLSADKDNEYFSDGITEELISRLSRITGLEVIARTSVMSYKGTTKKIADIGRELNIGTVLEGSVRKDGDKLRITAQLIRADSEAHLWAENYDRDVKGVFAVQKDIAERVATAMATALGVSKLSTNQLSSTQNIDAYNAYLKGRFHANKYTLEGMQAAILHFEEAIRLDANYALAYVGLAEAYQQLPTQDDTFSKDAWTKVRTAALKAIELDASLAEAHAALGASKAFYEYDWPGADAEFKRALALNPNSSSTYWWYAWYSMFLRRFDEGIAKMRRAIELDPVSITKSADLGWAHNIAGHWDESLVQFSRTLEMDNSNPQLYSGIGWAHLGKKQFKEAEIAFNKEIASFGREPWALIDLVSCYSQSGDIPRALAVLDEVKRASKDKEVSGWILSLAYVSLAKHEDRDRNELFRALNQAIDERSFWLVATSGVWWNPFHSDPRWIAFRKKMNLPP